MAWRMVARILLAIAVALAPGLAAAGMDDAASGVLAHQRPLPEAQVQRGCVRLAPDPQDDVAQDETWRSLPPPDCRVIAFERLQGSAGRWAVVRYRHSRGASRPSVDGVSSRVEEVVLLEAAGPGALRPVWRQRFFADGDREVWRSVTPQVAAASPGAVLLAVRYCVNGTGGCSQEFLRRGRDRTWKAVRQAWLEQLPKGFADRIRHGVEIDPATLKGVAGFYGDDDPNCCPSQELSVRLALRGEALMLLDHRVSRAAAP